MTILVVLDQIRGTVETNFVEKLAKITQHTQNFTTWPPRLLEIRSNQSFPRPPRQLALESACCIFQQPILRSIPQLAPLFLFPLFLFFDPTSAFRRPRTPSVTFSSYHLLPAPSGNARRPQVPATYNLLHLWLPPSPPQRARTGTAILDSCFKTNTFLILIKFDKDNFSNFLINLD